jgi:hypothetical protein
VKQAYTFYRIPADVLGSPEFWSQISAETELMRAARRDYFLPDQWRRILAKASQSDLPEWALYALGRVRERARTGASIPGFPGSEPSRPSAGNYSRQSMRNTQ